MGLLRVGQRFKRLGMLPCYQVGLLLELGSVRQWRGPKAAPRTY